VPGVLYINTGRSRRIGIERQEGRSKCRIVESGKANRDIE
jgi:hypothetical protein